MEQEEQCRFYEDDYPSEGDLVMGKVIKIQENGVYLDLLEYAGKSAIIIPYEYTMMMRKNIKKAIKIASEEVVRVASVDREKAIIELSKKNVDKDEDVETNDQYAKAKTVQSIARSVAGHVNAPLLDVLKAIVWPIYKKEQKPLEIFRSFLEEDELIKQYNLNPQWQEKLLAQIRRRFQPPVIKINAKFQLKINDFDGINIIKQALLVGRTKSRPDLDLLITILGAPVYLITVETRKRKQGIEVVNQSMQAIEKFIKQKGGMFKIKQAATVVHDKGKDDIHEQQVIGPQEQQQGMGGDMPNIDDIETRQNTSISA